MQKSRSCEPIAWHEMWHERAVLCLQNGSSGGRQGSRQRQHRDSAQRRAPGSGLRRARPCDEEAPQPDRGRPTRPEGDAQGRGDPRPAPARGRGERSPRTSATVDQLLDRYLDQFDGAPNTLTLRPVVDAVSYLARAAGDWLVLWTFHHRGLVEARGGCGTDEDGGWRSWDTFCGRGAISFQEGSGPRRSGCRCGRCCSARPPVSL